LTAYCRMKDVKFQELPFSDRRWPKNQFYTYLPPGGLILSLAHFGCILLF
jgi:hypothetical protein